MVRVSLHLENTSCATIITLVNRTKVEDQATTRIVISNGSYSIDMKETTPLFSGTNGAKSQRCQRPFRSSVGAWNGMLVHYAHSVCTVVPGKVYLPRGATSSSICDTGCSCSSRCTVFSPIPVSFLFGTPMLARYGLI